jgi:hypothetical protein
LVKFNKQIDYETWLQKIVKIQFKRNMQQMCVILCEFQICFKSRRDNP